MNELQIRGLAIMAAIALIVMLFALRRQPRGVWLFALALVAVGLGYLATTPAPAEFAEMLFGASAPAKAN
jgi:dipeptide/tripeptide permease